jgi:hypothetical protein
MGTQEAGTWIVRSPDARVDMEGSSRHAVPLQHPAQLAHRRAGLAAPAGWQPDPAWGPYPEGWEFWVQDDDPAPDPASDPQQPSPAPAPAPSPAPAPAPSPVQPDPPAAQPGSPTPQGYPSPAAPTGAQQPGSPPLRDIRHPQHPPAHSSPGPRSSPTAPSSRTPGSSPTAGSNRARIPRRRRPGPRATPRGAAHHPSPVDRAHPEVRRAHRRRASWHASGGWAASPCC